MRKIFTLALLVFAVILIPGAAFNHSAGAGLDTTKNAAVSYYICSVCGHVELSPVSKPCQVCNAPAEKYTQNDRIFEESAEEFKDASIKHIPVIKVTKKCGLIPEAPCVDIIVRIGTVLHPMEPDHYIQFVDCYVDNAFVERVTLTPAVYAAGCFHLKSKGTKVLIIEKCSIHGYWKNDAKL